MVLIKRWWLPLLALLLLMPVVVLADNPVPAVVPTVRQWTGGKGVWKISSGQVAVPAAEWRALRPVAERFAADLSLMGIPSVAVAVDGELPPDDLVLTTNTGNFQLRNNEGYAVEISDRVVIRGQTPAAVFWGTRTVLQMFRQDGRHNVLARGTVVDWPQYPNRVLHLNVGNRYLPLETLKDYVACMSWFKMNELQLCLNGADTGDCPQGFFRIECDSIPGLTSRDHYTRHQLRDLQDWAAIHGVAIVPEIRFPGDALAFTQASPDLRHPWLGKSQIDVRNPAAGVFLQKLFDEIIPLFDARVVHLGSRHCSIEGIPAGEVAGFGAAYRKLMDRMSTYVQGRFNKDIRLWEMSQDFPGTGDPLKKTTLDIWQGSMISSTRLAAGFKVINSSIVLPSAVAGGVQPFSRSLYETWTPDVFGATRLPPPHPQDEAPGLIGAGIRLWEGNLPNGQTVGEMSLMSREAIVAFAEKVWGAGNAGGYDAFLQRVAAIGIAPGVHLFDRLPATADGLVVRRSGLSTLKTPLDHVDILKPGSERLLEWPWTMAVEVRCDQPGDGVLLSTPSVEIYGALSWTVDRDGRRSLSRGIGIVRAYGMAAAPLQSQRPGVAVVDAVLKKYRWSRLVLVGERGRTTVYLDGAKVGEVGVQMVCPVGRLGGFHKDSFVCGIRNLEIWNRAWSAVEVEQWTPVVRSWWQSSEDITLGKP